MQLRHFALVALLTAACRDVGGPGVTDHPIRELPTELRFIAVADGDLEDGRHLQCSIDTYITITADVAVADGATIRTGTGGGEATRYKERLDGTTVGFWAHTYFNDLQVAYIGSDSVEIRSPQSSQATERFWKEFARFAGDRRAQDATQGLFAEGSWTCQPMDTPESSGGYFDNEGSITGRWTLMRAHP